MYDSATGETTPMYLFIAVLPCSCYIYAEVCIDMRLESWLGCHVHAYEYFGGVTRLLIPDNLKTGVVKNTRYETTLNRSYQELAEYYDTAIVPCRVEHPRDKSHAEGSVKYASTWILAALRNEHFFTISEAQEAVKAKLDELNHRPFTSRAGCRLSAYLNEEKAFMKPLPHLPYEMATWLPNISVGRDYLVSDGKNKYSVPFDLIGEKVDIRLTAKTVEVFFHGSRSASHVRKPNPEREAIINPDHMTPEHRKYLSYNAEEFTAWARETGEYTQAVISSFLSSGKEAEQGFKACASLTKLGERYGSSKLEAACRSVLACTSSPSVRLISTALKSGSKTAGKSEGHIDRNDYGITRGAAYYSKIGKTGKEGDQK